jgi:hypothetical protein
MKMIAAGRGAAAMVAIFWSSSSSVAGAREAWHRGNAHAESPACSASYARALERVREARLNEASEAFAVCSRAVCSEETRRECSTRRAQLDADIPSLVPLVTDDAGEPRILVEVRIDGALVTSRLDGRALPVDPGKHELTFGTDAGVFATRHLMVVQGERNRAIHVVLHGTEAGGLAPARAVVGAAARPAETPAALELRPLPQGEEAARAPAPREEPAGEDGEAPEAATKTASPSPSAGPGLGAAPWLFGTLGLAGVGGFGLMTYWGRNDNAMLSTCSPNCTNTSLRHVRDLYWAADASLGVGVVSLAVSTWLFASRASSAGPEPAGPVEIDVRPSHAGGLASVSGRF